MKLTPDQASAARCPFCRGRRLLFYADSATDIWLCDDCHKRFTSCQLLFEVSPIQWLLQSQKKSPSMRMFPIMDSSVITQIPWDMLAPHEERAVKTHGQTLERLAERGGLGCTETVAILDDKAFYDRWPVHKPENQKLAETELEQRAYQFWSTHK